jgi:AraC-like DNA-binding protein
VERAGRRAPPSEQSEQAAGASSAGVLTSLLLRLIDTSAALGADRASLLRASRTPEPHLHDPDARVPLAVYQAVWTEVVRQIPGAPVPVACAGLKAPSDFGLAGYLARQVPTLGEALAVLVRYQRLFHEGIGYTCEKGPQPGQMRASFPLSAQLLALPPFAETCALSLIGGVRMIVGEVAQPGGGRGPWRPLSVSLPLAAPPYEEAIRAFAGAPVRFEAGACEVVFAEADLALSAQSPDPALANWLRAQADATLEKLAPALPTTDAVARRLFEALPRGEGTQRSIARALGLGERTLQRRLGEEGITFAALLERSRRQLAEGLLRDKHLSASEVAFLLGYSDPSTFFRAFKRWTGRTPQQFRTG